MFWVLGHTHSHMLVYDAFAHLDKSNISPYHGNRNMCGSVWLSSSEAWEPDAATIVLVRAYTHTPTHTQTGWLTQTTLQTFSTVSDP